VFDKTRVVCPPSPSFWWSARLDDRANERRNERTNKRTNRTNRTNERTNERTNRTNERTNERTSGRGGRPAEEKKCAKKSESDRKHRRIPTRGTVVFAAATTAAGGREIRLAGLSVLRTEICQCLVVTIGFCSRKSSRRLSSRRPNCAGESLFYIASFAKRMRKVLVTDTSDDALMSLSINVCARACERECTHSGARV